MFLDFVWEVFGGGPSAVTSAAKKKCWEEMASKVFAVSGVERTGEEVKKKWVDLKSQAKGLAAGRKRSLKMTGGGEAENGEEYGMDSRSMNVIDKVCMHGVVGGVDTADVHLETKGMSKCTGS